MFETTSLPAGRLRSRTLHDAESRWLAAAVMGDPEAFTYLVETYQRPVYNLCYRMLGEAGEAEDAAQETFLRAYLSLKRYDRSRPFATWLLSIAAHYCIDQMRKRRAVLVSVDEDPGFDLPDLGPGPEAAASRGEEQRKIKGLLEKLNPTDRAAVVLYYWYEMSYEEIAQSLSLTVSAVKSRLHRARREMAESWLEASPQPVALEEEVA